MLALILAAVLEVRPSSAPIHIDAQLDEPAWAAATAVPVAYEWYPADNAAAPVATEALVTFDERNLYVAFRATDPQPGRIRARYHERDAATDDDVVGFYVDPFNDDRRAYQFRVNPLGVQIDAINSDVEGTEDFSWDAIWDSAGRLTADGYIVEIAVPLQQLRIPSTRGAQTWGFLAVREWPRDVQHRLRSVSTDQNRDCLVCQFQDLHGFTPQESGRNLEVNPTLTGTGGDVDDDSEAFNAGLSARWAVTPGTSLQATINPDFSQVEADAAQLDVNNRFALFFPEKRPFFVEGADVFETRLPLVFTRTIADPAAGLKITGKSGSHLYGALFARDELTNLLIPGDESSTTATIFRPSTTGFARYRAEVGESGTVGGLVTARRGEGYENLVLAGDSYYRISERDSVRVQLAGSRTTYPDSLVDSLEDELPQRRGAFEGHAFRASYNHNDANWSSSAGYTELAPGFRADSGFLNQVGVRTANVSADRRIRGAADRWYRNLYVGGGVDATREFDGQWTEWGADINFTYEGPRESSIAFNVSPNQEHFDGATYHNLRYGVTSSVQLSRDVGLGLYVRIGETIDFTNSQQAEFIRINPAVDLNLGRRFSGALEYDYQVLDAKRSGERVFDVHLPQARLLYHFSRRAFVRTILQYRMLDVVTSEQRRLRTQFLFSYRVNAQTVFLAGYSDSYEGERDLTRTNGTVFVKLGYAWLF
ncbi:MAG TPA: DUF5916 domain-containing protein [Thermoanaerobaculia bacterium]|jgi:hypothetical protein